MVFRIRSVSAVARLGGPLLGVPLLGATSICAPVLAQEPLAELAGLPEGSVLETVRAAVGTDPAAPDTVFEARRRAERARDRARAALRSEGYYAAQVEAQVEPGASPHARLAIDPGRRFALGQLRFEFTGEVSEEARAAARTAAALTAGAPARAADVINAETRAVAAVEAAGYPDVHALDRRVIVDHATGTMSVTLRIDAGRAAVFGPIVATGGARLRPEYLARVAPFEPGDRYDRDELDVLASRLQATGAFESAAVRLADSQGPGEGPEARPVIAEVRPGPRRTLTLGATYSTSEGGGVDGDWTRRNVFGGAESLTVSAALRTIDRSLGVELAAPHWRRPNRTLRLNAVAKDETTDAYDRQALETSAQIEQPLRRRLSGAIGTGLTLSKVDDGDAVQKFALAFVSGSISWDGANDALDPTRGARASLSARPTAGVGDEAVGYVVVEAAASVYKPLNDHVVAALRGRYGSILGPALANVPADERFFAGGGGSIRGYEYQSVSPRDPDGTIVGGRTLTEVSAELRYRGQGRLGYVAFVDGGAATDGLSPQADDLKWGAGVGMRYYTRVGPIRGDVAFPLDRRDGDPAVQLYISVGQAF